MKYAEKVSGAEKACPLQGLAGGPAKESWAVELVRADLAAGWVEDFTGVATGNSDSVTGRRIDVSKHLSGTVLVLMASSYRLYDCIFLRCAL